MIDSAACPSLEEILQSCGEPTDSFETLLEAERFSNQQIREARRVVAALPDAAVPGLTSFACGSLGRREASGASDLDFAVLYDSQMVQRDRACRFRDGALNALRKSFQVPEKTFGREIDLRALVRNVGGSEDNNQHLTHRALLLTEGEWLNNSVAAQNMKAAIFSTYAAAQISRGRYLNSLANDLHRYYRTVCVDYRHKVEELDKSWAIRVFKLRHARKVWHLSNLALHCWAVDSVSDDAQRDTVIAQRIGWPPLIRIASVVEYFGESSLVQELYSSYDRFLSMMGSSLVREELERLYYRDRNDSPLYQALRENANRLDDCAAKIVEVLLQNCREYLIRYFVL